MIDSNMIFLHSSTTKKIHIASADGSGKMDSPEVIEIPVWNGTVANLTLMALGSSAPEILLSIIEIVGNNFESGELGPGIKTPHTIFCTLLNLILLLSTF